MRALTLGDIAEWGSGGTPRRGTAEYFGPGVPWLSISDLNDGPVSSAKESLTRAGIENSSAKIVPADTLFVAMYGSIGKLGLATREMATSQAIAFAKPDHTLVDTRYLFHYLLAERPRLQARGRGGTQMNISQGDLKTWPILLPSLAEQRRIAAILDHADALRGKRRRVLDHLDDLTQSLFLSMFGGLQPSVTVQEVAAAGKGAIRTGPFGSQLLRSEFVDDGIAVLGLDNVVGNQFVWGERRFITPAKYQQLQRYTVHGGDVLISIMGTIGRCVVTPKGIPTAINTKHLCAITPDPGRVESEYLRAAFLWHPEARAHLRRQTKGSIMDGLNMGIIKSMPLPLPSLDGQRQFAARAAEVDRRVSLARRAHAHHDELFASLQSRAFRGEL